MKDYTVLLKDCVDRLCSRLQQVYKEYPVQDMRRVMSETLCFFQRVSHAEGRCVLDHMVFDVIGEITCARSFRMIENGEDHSYIQFIEGAMRVIT